MLHAPIYNKVFCGFIGGDYSIKVIGVGFALLVQLNRAMRRPLNVERATKYGSPRFFFIYA